MVRFLPDFHLTFIRFQIKNYQIFEDREDDAASGDVRRDFGGGGRRDADDDDDAPRWQNSEMVFFEILGFKKKLNFFIFYFYFFNP